MSLPHCPSSLYPFDLIHQYTYLCLSSFCHTRAFPIAPFPFLCLLFLSPGDEVAASPLPMCQTPVFSLSPIWSLCYSFHQYSIPSVSFLLLCHTPVFPLTLHVFCVFYYFHQLQHSHLYLPSLCATACLALYFVFVTFITLITSYTLYVSPLLCALLYRHFPLSFPFFLPLLCFFFCSKHQGRVVQSRVKITQG